MIEDRDAGHVAFGGRPGEGFERPRDAEQLLVRQDVEQHPQLALVELAEPVRDRSTGRRGSHDDLATIVRILPPGREPLVHEAVHQAAHRRERDPERRDQLRHVELAGGLEQVEHLGLGHRDPDLEELGAMDRHQPSHHRRVSREDVPDRLLAIEPDGRVLRFRHMLGLHLTIWSLRTISAVGGRRSSSFRTIHR